MATYLCAHTKFPQPQYFVVFVGDIFLKIYSSVTIEAACPALLYLITLSSSLELFSPVFLNYYSTWRHLEIIYSILHFKFYLKCFIQVLCPFFNWIVCFGVEFCKFFIHFGYQPLSDVSANMFSHSMGCLFILLMASFAVQKLFSLMQSHLVIFSFVSLAGEDISDKILL